MTTQLMGQAKSMGFVIKMVAAEIKAQQVLGLKQIPTLAGPPGIGKTASLKALGQEMGLETIVYQLSAKSPEEFSGIPDFIKAPDDLVTRWSTTGADSSNFTKWSIPEIVANVNQRALKNKKGVLVLFDDIHMTDPALERYLFNLFLDKVVGEYKLEDNVYVVAAMNTTDMAGFSGFNSAIMDRLAIYKVDFDFQHWYDIMASSLHPMVAAFLKNYAESEKELILGEESVDKVSPTPRSWTELSTFLKIFDDTKLRRSINLVLNSEVLVTAARARVGELAANKFNEFYNIYINYDFRRILDEQKMISVSKTDPIEQLLYGSISRFISNKKDAEFAIELYKYNKVAASFATSFIYEFISYYKGLKRNKIKPNVGLEHLKKWIVTSQKDAEQKLILADVSSLLD